MNLDLLRSFFAVTEHGSLSQAAARLHVSQSTLTRQMHALEHELGGRLLERSTSGVALTATGHRLFDGMRPVLASFDQVIDDTRKFARGQRATLRIGYLMSAGSDYLNPALGVLRRQHPEIKVKLIDLSPGEQIAALRKGELDLALLDNAGSFLAREFFVRRVATVPVHAALPETHPLAAKASLALADLRFEHFIGAPEADMPGHREWIGRLCRRAGFRPRFVHDAESLGQMLSSIVAEGAVALLPEYAARSRALGVAFRPLRDAAAKTELHVVWPRGQLAAPIKAMLSALPAEKRVARV